MWLRYFTPVSCRIDLQLQSMVAESIAMIYVIVKPSFQLERIIMQRMRRVYSQPAYFETQTFRRDTLYRLLWCVFVIVDFLQILSERWVKLSPTPNSQ